MNAIENYF